MRPKFTHNLHIWVAWVEDGSVDPGRECVPNQGCHDMTCVERQKWVTWFSVRILVLSYNMAYKQFLNRLLPSKHHPGSCLVASPECPSLHKRDFINSSSKTNLYTERHHHNPPISFQPAWPARWLHGHVIEAAELRQRPASTCCGISKPAETLCGALPPSSMAAAIFSASISTPARQPNPSQPTTRARERHTNRSHRMPRHQERHRAGVHDAQPGDAVDARRRIQHRHRVVGHAHLTCKKANQQPTSHASPPGKKEKS